MPDFSIIIQGRLHKNSLEALDVYRRYGQVILDSPESDDFSLLEGVDLDGIVRVTHPADMPNTTFNGCSGYYHCISILAGLRQATAEFSIKLRSDVLVGNLQPMLDKILQHPDKYVCSHLYFRPDRIAKFHPSDQIVGMKTDVFIETMEIACYRLIHHSEQLRQCFNDHRQCNNAFYTYYKDMPGSAIVDPDIGVPRGQGLTPEVLFGTSYLAAKGILQIPAESRRIMLENFEVIALEDMFPYKDRYGNVNQIQMGGLPVIRSMGEL
jgi:hypothetical protein